MEPRKTKTTVRFNHPFTLTGAEHALAPGEYEVTTEEELVEGLSFPAYRRVSTTILLKQGSRLEMLVVQPSELEAAEERDRAQSRAAFAQR